MRSWDLKEWPGPKGIKKLVLRAARICIPFSGEYPPALLCLDVDVDYLSNNTGIVLQELTNYNSVVAYIPCTNSSIFALLTSLCLSNTSSMELHLKCLTKCPSTSFCFLFLQALIPISCTDISPSAQLLRRLYFSSSLSPASLTKT